MCGMNRNQNPLSPSCPDFDPNAAFSPFARLRAFYFDHLYRPLDWVRARMDAIRASRIQSAALCFGVLAVLPFAYAMCPAALVSVGGQPIGAAADAATAQAVAAAIQSDLDITTGGTGTLGADLDCRTGFVLKSDVLDADDLRQAILDALDGVSDLAAILVSGEPVVYCDSTADAETAIDAVRVAYQEGNEDTSPVFLEPITVRTMAAPSDYAAQRGVAASELTSAVDVRVYETVFYTEAIPYETVTRENVEMPVDETAVVQEGRSGEAAVNAQVVKINGKVRERTIVSRAVLAEPQKRIVEIGTKKPGVGSGTLACPLADYTLTSGFQTETRARHAGVDLGVPTGSTVMAADDGRVIVAEWSDSYGYYVVLDHGNGMQTLYAHNSGLTVQAGDTVQKGDQIAISGGTGNSSGPHVHFEVHKDGVAVDPAAYVAF